MIRPLHEATACIHALEKNWQTFNQAKIEKIIAQCEDHLRSIYDIIERDNVDLDSVLEEKLSRIHNNLADFRSRLPTKGGLFGWFRALLAKTIDIAARFLALFTKHRWRIDYTTVHSLEDSKNRYE